tara:strand:+ start:1054 stop:2022 length:969 start_codon:yes stop_codon:yes gene_type:complete
MKVSVIGEIHSSGWEILNKSNFEVFEINNFEPNNLKEELKNVDGILLRTSKLDENVLSHCKNLKIIARHGVGYDNIDYNYLNKNKIALTITGTSNAVTVAEYVLTAFLSLARKIELSDKLVKTGKFKEKKTLPDFFEIYQKKILICGFGRIGKAVAKRCLGFEAKVYVYDPFVNDKEILKANCIPIEKNEGLKTADYITLHLPLKQNTRNFISTKEFDDIKNTAIIVNASRGGIINEEALIVALKNNQIQAAALDVFEKEPPIENHPIYSFNNVLLSPHNSALTLECRERMSIEAASSIVNYLTDKKKLNLDNLINKEHLEI